MDHFEETRPSIQINSFASTSLKGSILDHTSDTSRKPQKPLNSHTPTKDLLTSSRGYSYCTPRTQVSLSNANEKEIHLNDTLLKSKDDLKSLDSAALEFTLDDESKDIPTLKWCAFCKKEVMTEVFSKNNSTTFWASVSILLMGGVCGCFMLPYMVDSCKDVASRCSRCKREIRGGSEELI